MATIPTYGNPVQTEALPGARVATSAPDEAFGGGASARAVGGAARELSNTVESIFLAEKKKADDVSILSGDNKLAALQTQLEVKTKKMQGRDAAGAPDVIGEEWQKGVEAVTKDLSNDDQRRMVAQHASMRWQTLDKNIQFHVADETRKYDQNETEGYIANSRNAAALNAGDEARVALELQRQAASVTDWAKRNGVPTDSPQYKEKVTAILSKTSSDVIQARLTADDVKGARSFLAKSRETMTADDVLRAEKLVDNAETLNDGLAAWNKVSRLTLSDGNPDLARMQASVFASPGSVEKREKVWSFVKARAAESIVSKSRAEAADDREFMNSVLEARKSGQPLDAVLKFTASSARDDYDQAIKTEAVQKIFAPPTASDPGTFMNIWERVQGGNASKTEIDSAMQANRINVADWRSLREDLYRRTVEGRDPEHKANWERIKAFADEKYGSSKVAREQFLYEMHSAAQGKTAEETWKLANDKVKGDANTGVFGFFQSEQWKTDLKRRDAQGLAWGKAYQDIGKSEVTEIGRGALYSGKSAWGLSDVDAFAAQFGGYDKIKAGTPVNNAIQSLTKHGKLVTPANVRAVIEKYPDGSF